MIDSKQQHLEGRPTLIALSIDIFDENLGRVRLLTPPEVSIKPRPRCISI